MNRKKDGIVKIDMNRFSDIYDDENYISVDDEYIFNHTYVDDNGDLRCKDCGELLMSEFMEY